LKAKHLKLFFLKSLVRITINFKAFDKMNKQQKCQFGRFRGQNSN
jgi:hypothetical protein